MLENINERKKELSLLRDTVVRTQKIMCEFEQRFKPHFSDLFKEDWHHQCRLIAGFHADNGINEDETLKEMLKAGLINEDELDANMVAKFTGAIDIKFS